MRYFYNASLLILAFTVSLLLNIAYALEEHLDYKEHGVNWGGICANGTRQSPINIDTSLVKQEGEQIPDFTMNNITNGTIVHDMNLLQVDYTGGTLSFINKGRVSSWGTLQFHFHSPSEHTIDGERFDAEMHLVTKGITKPDELLVVSVLFKICDEASNNEFIESLELEDLEETQDGLQIDVAKLYHSIQRQDVYYYTGSLTTPPCSEIVSWVIFTNPVSITSEQLEQFSRFWAENEEFAHGNGNNRMTQPMNGREVHFIRRNVMDILKKKLSSFNGDE